MRMLMTDIKFYAGIFVVVVSIFYLIKAIYDRMTAIVLDGEVVGFTQNQRDGGYYKMIKFTYQGEELTMSSISGSKTPKGNVGDQVVVLYNPKNQKNVNIKGDYTEFIVIAAAIFIGVLFIFDK